MPGNPMAQEELEEKIGGAPAGADAAREMRYHDAVYFSTRLPTPAHHRHRAPIDRGGSLRWTT